MGLAAGDAAAGAAALHERGLGEAAAGADQRLHGEGVSCGAAVAGDSTAWRAGALPATPAHAQKGLSHGD